MDRKDKSQPALGAGDGGVSQLEGAGQGEGIQGQGSRQSWDLLGAVCSAQPLSQAGAGRLPGNRWTAGAGGGDAAAGHEADDQWAVLQ